MGGERTAKRSSFGSKMRKRLSDITNSQAQPKPLSQEEKPQQISPAAEAEDYINQLIKEKMTLMKLTEERNKIIELSGIELQNLRISLQKLQLQNWNLAQSNSQMLAELNLGRDRVKALQHELVCKDALLKAKNLEMKQGKADCQHTGSQGGEEQVAKESMPKANDDDNPCARNRRRNARSQSMGPSTTSQRGGDKEKIENKRRCLRRQSARFKSQEREPTESLFEIDDVKLAATQQLDAPLHEDDPSGVSIAMEETCNLRAETHMLKRSSIGRPLRKAVEKVQSYKEIPVNVKMRRND